MPKDAAGTQTWKNATGTLTAHPGKLIEAKSEADFVAAVKDAKAADKRVRGAGGGHSWYPLVLVDDALDDDNADYVIVTMETFNGVTTETRDDPTAPGGKRHLVHVEPGATMGDVQAATVPAKLAFPTNGVIPRGIQEGGFVAAGCHGTGWDEPTVSDLVYALDIVLSLTDDGGRPLVCRFTNSGPIACWTYDNGQKVDRPIPSELQGLDGQRLMGALRVNLGSVGLMSRITFNAVPMFHLAATDALNPMAEVVERPDSDSGKLRQLLTANDYVELFWFPYNDVGGWPPRPQTGDVWTKTWNRTTQPVHDVPTQDGWDILKTWLGGEALKVIVSYPDKTLTPLFLNMVANQAYKPYRQPQSYVGLAPQVFHYAGSAFDVLDFSFAIPLDDQVESARKAWYDVVDAVIAWSESEPDEFPVNVTLHARFIKNSPSLISPAYQPPDQSGVHTCFIEFLSVAPDPATHQAYYETWTTFCNQIGQKWMALGGRPHWAKDWQTVDGIYDHIRQSFQFDGHNNLDQFKTLRATLDPGQTFLNAHVAKILGVTLG